MEACMAPSAIASSANAGIDSDVRTILIWLPHAIVVMHVLQFSVLSDDPNIPLLAGGGGGCVKLRRGLTRNAESIHSPHPCPF
jgi:hypothetical protein